MASLMHKLGSNEAAILMYLAGELSAEDRAELEQMLAGDAALREQLQALRELQDEVNERLAAVESPRLAGEAMEMGMRRLLREMRRQRLEVAARAMVVQPARRRPPKWAYTVASAAAAVFVLIGLWGVGVFDPRPAPTETGSDFPVAEAALDEAVLADGWLVPSAGGAALDEATHRIAELPDEDDDDRLLLML